MMKIVRLLPDWTWTEKDHLINQTPKKDGVWGNLKFTLDDIDECDYLIVFNKVIKDIKIKCPPGNKWLISGEPPVPMFTRYSDCYKYFDRLFIQDDSYVPDNNIVTLTHGALPWFLKKDYSFLKDLEPGDKNLDLSVVMSNANTLPGHHLRNSFLDHFKTSGLETDIFGRGIRFVDDKFDALYPYKYSLAFENMTYPHYWTEKISDCFLSWTMPIYYGAPNIADYFPAEALVMIDINQPNEAVEIIQKTIRDKTWEKNRKAIEHARNLVLHKYQLFPFLTDLIENNTSDDTLPKEHFFIPKTEFITSSDKKTPLLNKVKNKVKKLLFEK